jgi:FtsZ-binding cell division protein ZapB
VSIEELIEDRSRIRRERDEARTEAERLRRIADIRLEQEDKILAHCRSLEAEVERLRASLKEEAGR